MKNNGHAAVLLNGAFENHIAAPPYRKSRGLVFLEIIADTFPVKKFADIFLNNIEPFTLILFGDGKLYESRWNGTNKFITELDSNTPHIWSSATLYDAGTIKKRAQWFTDWLVKNPYPSQQQVLFFHQFAGDGDSANSLHINRKGIMLTVSVTSMSMQNDKAVMRYLDLKNKNIHEQQMKLHSQFQAIY